MMTKNTGQRDQENVVSGSATGRQEAEHRTELDGDKWPVLHSE